MTTISDTKNQSDRALLELAAKAVGTELWHEDVFTNGLTQKVSDNGILCWNPLTDDGDALRLAVKLELDISFETWSDGSEVVLVEDEVEYFDSDPYAATRRAIVIAAAEIGKTL